MSRESVLARGQAAALQGMTDACVIKRKTGETTSGGVITPTWSTLYTGICRVQAEKDAGQAANIGEAFVMVMRRVVQLPMSAPAPREGDEVTITASATNAELVGRVYRVRDDPEKTHQTARRVTVIEVGS